MSGTEEAQEKYNKVVLIYAMGTRTQLHMYTHAHKHDSPSIMVVKRKNDMEVEDTAFRGEQNTVITN
jgi:hypothetical protein